MIKQFQGDYRFLSNFYPCEIEYGNLTYPSVEHAYQAAKTNITANRLFIANIKSPGEAKKWARKNIMRNKEWDNIKVDIMIGLVWTKFEDPILRKRLLATGAQELQEGNYWGDMFWGGRFKYRYRFKYARQNIDGCSSGN